jgi:hypothetical protein
LDVQPEVKEALELLGQWYSEDLLPKGIMTTSKRDNDIMQLEFVNYLKVLSAHSG